MRRRLLLAGLCLLLPGAGWARSDAGSSLRPLDVPRELRVVSYYPADAGWTRMWEPWRPQQISEDLRRLRALNANTVRIVLAAHYFGYPKPERQKLERLEEFVSLAAQERLHVHFTLFDWWEEYGDVEGSKRWARAVLEPYVGDPRLAFVELRNELDVGNRQALAWTRELLPWLRRLLGPRTPVTVSVAGVNPVNDLRVLVGALPAAARPTFFDAHYFTGGGEQAQRVFSTLRKIAAPTPLWIGEVGYPSSSTVTGYTGVPVTPSGQEAAQAHFLKLCFTALARLGLPAPGIWILRDFAPGAIPDSDVSPSEPEYRFGLYRENGSAKPAAGVVRRLFAGRFDPGFNGGFEAAALAEDGTRVPALWGSVGDLRLVRVDSGARSGAAAALVSGPQGGTGTFMVTPVTSSVEVDRRAEMTVWVRGTSALVRVGIGWFDSTLAQIGETWTVAAAGRAWRRVVVSGRPPADADFARLIIRVSGLQGTVRLDDAAFDWR